MVLRQIGTVRSAIVERKLMPSLGAPAAIELLPAYADGLLRFEKHSYVWVLAWLDGAERDVLQVTPRGVADRSEGGLHGVFSVRSPARPNPIGLSAARVVRRQGLRIEVDRLDFADGTPVIDLKPYFVTRDMVFSATNVTIGKPTSAAALRESLLMQAANFHGECCRDAALAVRIAEHFRTRFFDLGEPERWNIEVPAGRTHLIDAWMGMTRTSLGHGTMRLSEGDEVVIRLAAGVAKYEIATSLSLDFEGVLHAPREELFSCRYERFPDASR